MSDFYNVQEMFQYLARLKEYVDSEILLQKEKLNNLCECCHEKEIEVEYRPDNFCDEYFEDEIKKYKINVNFFCENCYEILLEREEIGISQFSIFYNKKEEI